MKKNFTLLLVLTSFLVLAQPAGYYNTATGTGYTLKTQLKTIITSNHIDRGYGGLWTLYATNSSFHDQYDDNDGSIYDIYSEIIGSPETGNYPFTPVTDQCGSYSFEGDCYNREHLIPQSYFDVFAVNPMKNDPFHVFPSDGKVNGWRSNYPFGVVEGITSPCNSGASNTPCNSLNNSKKGNNKITQFSNYSGIVFEPIDAFKGDIARAYFYFATRYEDSMDNFYSSIIDINDCPAKNMFDGSINKVFSDNFILLLIKWHKEDPVSAKEVAQNNAIYTYQGNRNPFIDNPNYVCQIWTSQCAVVDGFLASESFAFENNLTIYPNPTINNEVYVESELELKTIILYNVNGQIIQEIKNPSKVENNAYKVSNLPTGFYIMQLASENASTTKKLIVN